MSESGWSREAQDEVDVDETAETDARPPDRGWWTEESRAEVRAEPSLAESMLRGAVGALARRTRSGRMRARLEGELDRIGVKAFEREGETTAPVESNVRVQARAHHRGSRASLRAVGWPLGWAGSAGKALELLQALRANTGVLEFWRAFDPDAPDLGLLEQLVRTRIAATAAFSVELSADLALHHWRLEADFREEPPADLRAVDDLLHLAWNPDGEPVGWGPDGRFGQRRWYGRRAEAVSRLAQIPDGAGVGALDTVFV